MHIDRYIYLLSNHDLCNLIIKKLKHRYYHPDIQQEYYTTMRITKSKATVSFAATGLSFLFRFLPSSAVPFDLLRTFQIRLRQTRVHHPIQLRSRK